MQKGPEYRKPSFNDSVFVCATSHSPIHGILDSVTTTADATFFSWSQAYLVFPATTFGLEKILLMRPLSDFFRNLTLQEYQRLGLKVQDVLVKEEFSWKTPIKRFRRVGDKHTWVIPLDTTGVEPAKNPR